MLEVEVKYYLGSEAEARTLAERLELVWQEGRFEVNRVFDFPDGRLASAGALVRVRTRAGSASSLTYKAKTGRQVPNAKVRLEHDSGITDPDAVIRLLEGIGLTESLRYERYRAVYALPGAAVALDQLPGGWFCEIEGDPEAIVRVAHSGGLKGATPVAWSYPEMLTRLGRWNELEVKAWDFALTARGQFRIPAADDPWWQTE